MPTQSFSQRFGYVAPQPNLILEDAPEQIREGLQEVLITCGYTNPLSQRALICHALRKRPDPNNWSEYPNVDDEVQRLIYGCVWHEFYDMCERIARLMAEADGLVFSEEINRLFQEERIGYRMVNGKFEKIGTPQFQQATSNAAISLSGQPPLGPVSLQFEKALAFRNAFPPDYANAVKEAVNAVEGLLQVVTNRPGVALPTIVSALQPQLPSHVERIVKEIYGYGSGSQGARHAGIGGHVSESDEAEFVIHTASAAITYLKKYG